LGGHVGVVLLLIESALADALNVLCGFHELRGEPLRRPGRRDLGGLGVDGLGAHLVLLPVGVQSLWPKCSSSHAATAARSRSRTQPMRKAIAPSMPGASLMPPAPR